MNLEGIIFVITTVILNASFILIKKVDKKISILTFIGITAVINMCYNAFICYVLTFFNIPNKLYILAIINLVISIILIIKILRKNKNNKFNIQEYSINRVDSFSAVVILIITLLVTFLNFRFPFNIKYETGDPATHYLTSIKFMQEEKLLTNSKDFAFGNFETRKFASYVNSGLLMKCFEGKINVIDNYVIFIAFGIFILYLTGYLIYFILCRFTKNEKNKILALIVSILCLLGYPLNSLLFGFEYMSMSFTIILAIIAMMFMIKEDKIKFSYSIIILFLINFGLFCSYYMFVPFVYSAEWIYLCIYSYKKEKKIICKNNIIMLTVTLLVPFFLGYIYHMEPSIYKILINNSIDTEEILDVPKSLIGSGFNGFGYIYTNLYSNFILLLPLALYVVIRKFKENKFLSILFILNVLYIILLLIGRAFDKVSYYYLSKNYFTLWIIIFILNFRGLMYLAEKQEILPIMLVVLYVGILVVYLISVPTVLEKGEKVSSRENIFTLMDICGSNKYIIQDCEEDFNHSEIELLKYILENYDLEDNYLIFGNPEQISWGYSFTQYVVENDETENRRGQNKFDVTFLEYDNLLNKAKYVIYFKYTLGYKYLNEELFENSTILYSNDVGGLLVKNEK